MGIIESNKIIFKSCFFQAFKGNTCCIDTQRRCACMCRNTFGIDGQGSIFFGYFTIFNLWGDSLRDILDPRQD